MKSPKMKRYISRIISYHLFKY